MTALQAELRTSDVLHEQLEFLLDRLAELLVAPLPDAPASGGAARRIDETRIGARGGVHGGVHGGIHGGVHGGGAEAVVPFPSGEATIMTTSTAAAVAAAAAAGVSDGGRWWQMAADGDRWRKMAVPGVADGGVDALSSRDRGWPTTSLVAHVRDAHEDVHDVLGDGWIGMRDRALVELGVGAHAERELTSCTRGSPRALARRRRSGRT